jgi:hypothetical protein
MAITAFHVHKNGVEQTGFSVGATGQYNLVTWPYEKYDVGNAFANNAWTPVPSGSPALVAFTGRLWIINATSTIRGVVRQYVARIVKNGDIAVGETIVAECGSKDLLDNELDSKGLRIANITLSAQDIAQPGDSYRIYLFVTNPAARIDAHPLGHTMWQGAIITT